MAPVLGRRGAAQFQAALISDTLRKVSALGREVAPYLFLAGRNFPLASTLARYTLVRQRGASLGERLERALQRLLTHHSRAIVIGTDSPGLPPRILRQALRELRVCDAVLGPCKDGGFYLIGLRRLDKGMFRGVRWGSAFAFQDTLENILRSGFSCAVLESCADVDRPTDIQNLMEKLSASRAARRLAPGAWAFLKNSFPAGRMAVCRAKARRYRTREIQPPPNTSSPS